MKFEEEQKLIKELCPEMVFGMFSKHLPGMVKKANDPTRKGGCAMVILLPQGAETPSSIIYVEERFLGESVGNDPNQLKSLLPENPEAVYISNGLDFAKPESQKKHQDWDLRELNEISISTEQLDLRKYFGRQAELRSKLQDVDLIYVSGGNVYDLRIAMQLSGFDEILKGLISTNKVYGGYSAAVCVLSPTLKGYHVVDDPNLKTYGDYETMWEGIGLIDWQFAPHFDSDHSESEDINKEIAYYKDHGIEFKALRDGDVIILDEESLSK